MDGGAWYATVHGIAESVSTEQLHWLVPSTEQAFFNFVTAVTVYSDFGPQEN